ncbi:hypothetical protein EVAR_44917_1 [Eumeta japonica]|uniref:Uncharacterized protein n=1 Tax=Eumeta variegata TaxID=151549 RepID=A0A4C1XNL2_EUMVA|nr:hypothetical protein EVAR_44917_1 [Eumeta japonica]
MIGGERHRSRAMRRRDNIERSAEPPMGTPAARATLLVLQWQVVRPAAHGAPPPGAPPRSSPPTSRCRSSPTARTIDKHRK